jgi:hypothetical protein
MKNLENIEKSSFRKGEYVGYANGVWAIRRANTSYGNWSAEKRDERNVRIYAHTLEQMSSRLKESEQVVA